ncbi:MAG: hypothetical protein K2L62_00545, partial [Muribaculaceae bacterium]|nr:hypothetical protein [Muribaculaceae bacterium]
MEYPFEYILTENEPASSLETKDNILDQFGRLTSGFYYFTPELDLSGLRNPVMRLWRAPGVYSTSDDGAVALSRESRAVAVTSPRENKPTALPALDKLKVGLGSKVPHGTVITISEWKSSYNLFTRYCKKNITKGTLQKDGIRPDGAENDIFRYAEAVFDFCNDTDESAQSLIVVRSNHEFETCDAFDSDQYGAAMICRAITTKGEVAPYLLGVDDQSDPDCRLSYYLRPSGCSNIRLTWRVPAEREDLLVTPGNPGTGMQEDFCYFSYPSYMNAPTLDFDLSYLSTARPDATSTAALVPTGSSGFNPNLTYDFNGNGIKEW